ncbi:MAG: phosphodiesterase [bacterium]
MKYIIASDIHGSEYYANELIKKFHELKADKLILLGDILYHGPRNPLPKDYNPQGVVKLIQSIKNKVLWIKGNCDSEVDEMIMGMNFVNDGVLVINNTNFFLSHGHIKNEDNNNLSEGDYLICGHTHINKHEVRNNIHYLNCGSVSLPKENTKNSFLVIENKVTCLDFDNNVIFEVEYV